MSAGDFTTALIRLGPAAYWPLDDPIGTTAPADVMGGPALRQLSGATGVVQHGQPDPWNRPLAASFDGASGLVQNGASVVTALPSPVSLVAYYRVPQISSGLINGLVALGNGQGLTPSQTAPILRLSGTGLLTAAHSPAQTSEPTRSDDNEWHLGVMTWDTTENVLRVYRDGVLGGSAAGPAAPIFPHPNPWWRLGMAGGGTFLTGWLCQAALFGRLLTDAEIAGLYAAAIAPPPPVSSFSPTEAYAYTSITMTIIGTNIADATGVLFDELEGSIANIETIPTQPGGENTRITAISPILPDRPVFTLQLRQPGRDSRFGTLDIITAETGPEPPGPGGVPMHQGRCLALANFSSTLTDNLSGPRGTTVTVTNLLDLMDHDLNGITVETVDLGFPDIREDTGVWPDADGTWDFTRFFGARGVTLSGVLLDQINSEGTVTGSRSKALDRLARFLLPPARPILIYCFNSDSHVAYLRLRAAGYSGPVNKPNMTSWQGQWKCPDGFAYAMTPKSVIVVPFEALTFGRIYTEPQPEPGPPGAITTTSGWKPNRHYPEMRGAASGLAVNAGTVPTWPVFQITDCTGAFFVNDTTGQTFAMKSNFVVHPGEVLTIDTRNRRVFLGKNYESGSRYNQVDFARSSWWPLIPGNNSLRFDPAAAGPQARLTTYWQDAFL